MKGKSKAVIVGLLISGLTLSNVFTYMNLQKEQQESQKWKEKFTVLTSTLNQSDEYASHEDMKASFDLYSGSNRIHYKGNDYYFDVNEILSHNYDSKKQYSYKANANISFLKDKIENNMSYLQTILPRKLGEKLQEKNLELKKQLAKGEESEDLHSNPLATADNEVSAITKKMAIQMENEAKKDYIVSKDKMDLTFSIQRGKPLQVSEKTKNDILKLFVRDIVAKDKSLSADAQIEVSTKGDRQLVKVIDKGKTFYFQYDFNSKDFIEKK